MATSTQQVTTVNYDPERTVMARRDLAILFTVLIPVSAEALISMAGDMLWVSY